MNVQSWNFWLGFIVTCGFFAGMVWGVIRWYHNFISKVIERKAGEDQRKARIEALDLRFGELEKDLRAIKKDITPNGRNTQRLGDIAARTEEKVDNLMGFMERYAEKVDALERDFSAHLGYHEGAEL